MEGDFNERVEQIINLAHQLFNKKEYKSQMTVVYYGGKSKNKIDLKELNKHLYINKRIRSD